ncbi:MAG: hypothetical protein DMG21_02935 [Acidobacteria bacterium]|nr:MAG: hypothetical protein DMG21_02935 [Acidobacteriota bacterium]
MPGRRELIAARRQNESARHRSKLPRQAFISSDWSKILDDRAPFTLDAFSRETLEFPAVVTLLARRLSGPLAAPLMARLEPGTDLDAIQRELQLVGEAMEFLKAESRPSFAEMGDPRGILAGLRVEGQTCSAAEILSLLALVGAVADVRALLAKSLLRLMGELARALADFQVISKTLEGKILPDGTLDSSASPELKRLRLAILETRGEIERTLEKLLRRWEAAGALQDAVVTLRNDRFVLPVKVEEKRRVEGVVHGASASGATVFVDPLETLPLNNELPAPPRRLERHVSRAPAGAPRGRRIAQPAGPRVRKG